jgi:hypothetical protein
MDEFNLELPSLLRSLLASGQWPRTGREAMSQNLHPIIAPDRVKLFAEDESTIYLNAPPFRTVADEATCGSQKFWEAYGALQQISADRALIIGDFGLGSDAPIILDYREGELILPVLRLRWSETAPGKPQTKWVKGADSFEKFAQILGLIQPT